ncbi:hypothetical protein [Vreelandella massiliensis]|uniref:hypothetical protein n=1 Tax=Vreelandella massiliensis TaxID=1816686 RepID=UPI00096A7D0B|nr:hypothetical protein [Halomonas massiliensis]
MSTTTFPLHHSFYLSVMELIEEAESTGDTDLIGFASEVDATPFQAAWDAVREHCQGELTNLCGIELRNDRIQQWATILVDPTNPSIFRAQYYAANGFQGHACYQNAIETLDELIRSGFQTLDNGALERMSATSEWQVGCEVTSILQRINSGTLSYREGEQRYQALLAQTAHSQREDDAA